MTSTEHTANTASTPKTGLCATLSNLLRAPGSGALSRTPFLAALAALIAGVALFALPAASAVAAGDANTAGCSPETEASPGFRSFLPDCRADELVTPPYVGGEPLSTELYASADGEQLITRTLGGFAGTGDIEEDQGVIGAYYELSRTAVGWSAEALDPPASQFPRSIFQFAGADLTRSLWEVVVPPAAGEEEEVPSNYEGWSLAVRQPGGHFVLLGPVVAPEHERAGTAPDKYRVLSASGDLSHVVLSVGVEHSQQWPGDESVEGVGSLYEYSEADPHEPVLVGVRNSGRLNGNGSPYVNHGASLVSECGIGFAAEGADGERTVFTAAPCSQNAGEPAVSEVYARVNGSETVKISGASAAEFRGASEDAKLVFFSEGGKLFEYNFEAPLGERVSLVATEVSGAGVVVAEEGLRVYFQATGVLSAAENAHGEVVNANGEEAEVGRANLYVYDTQTGRTAFVANETEQLQTTHSGVFAVFSSAKEIRGTNDTGPVPQLFEYEAEGGDVARVSAGKKSGGGYECPATKVIEAGYDCDGNTTDGLDVPELTEKPSDFNGKVLPTEATADLSLAQDGTVVFGSPLALTPGAPTGEPVQNKEGYLERGSENVYEYRNGEVYLISRADEGPLTHATHERVRGIDVVGTDVFFETPFGLVPQATGTQENLYDAREDGGFPAPEVAYACQGEACQGAAPATPALAAPAVGSSGAGNLAPVSPTPVKISSKPKTAAQIRSEALKKALKACRVKRSRQRRARCQKIARKKFGPEDGKKASDGGRGQ